MTMSAFGADALVDGAIDVRVAGRLIVGRSSAQAVDELRGDRPNARSRHPPLNGGTQILERGGPDLSPEAERASRVAIGHAEGMPLAFANLAEQIHARKGGAPQSPPRSNPRGAQANGPTRARLPCGVRKTEGFGFVGPRARAKPFGEPAVAQARSPSSWPSSIA